MASRPMICSLPNCICIPQVPTRSHSLPYSRVRSRQIWDTSLTRFSHYANGVSARLNDSSRFPSRWNPAVFSIWRSNRYVPIVELSTAEQRLVLSI